MDDRYYKASGIAPNSGLVMMLAGGMAVGAILGGIYAVVSFYNPFIYINFLGTVFLGLAVGGTVLMAGKRGRVRNSGTSSLIGLVTGIFALYMSWVFYIYVVTDYQVLPYSPLTVFSVVQLIAAKGVWALSSWTPTGIALYLFWAIEAGIVIIAAAFVAASNDSPFCEICGLWTEETEEVVRLKNADEDLLKQALEEEHYEVLQKLPLATRYSADCLHVSLDACTICDDSNFLTVRHVVTTKDKDGDESTDTTDIVRNLRIPQSVVEDLESGERPDEDSGEDDDAQDLESDEDTLDSDA